MGMAGSAVAGATGWYLYDYHAKAKKKAHDQPYKEGYEASNKSQHMERIVHNATS